MQSWNFNQQIKKPKDPKKKIMKQKGKTKDTCKFIQRACIIK